MTLPEFGEWPDYRDRSTFEARVAANLPLLGPWGVVIEEIGINTQQAAAAVSASEINAAQSATDALDSKLSAEDARDLAQAAGDVRGIWSSLTGSLPIGAAVSHLNRLWVAVKSIANVTLSQPSVSNTDWLAVTPPIGGTLSKSSAYTVTEDDDKKIITCTASLTLSFPSASDLGVGWSCNVKNTSSGNVTLDPYSTQTIDGVLTCTTESGDMFFIISDGANLQCEKISGYKAHYITSSQTWVCPAGITEIFVQLQAAGGGGGRGSSSYGSGASAGGYSEGSISVVAGGTKTITLGAAGAGATIAGIIGTDASASSFDTDITCGGGYGGKSTYTSQQTSFGSAVGGDLNIPGGLPTGVFDTAYAGSGGDSFFGSGQRGWGEPHPANVSYGIGGSPGKNASALSGGAAICIIWY